MSNLTDMIYSTAKTVIKLSDEVDRIKGRVISNRSYCEYLDEGVHKIKTTYNTNSLDFSFTDFDGKTYKYPFTVHSDGAIVKGSGTSSNPLTLTENARFKIVNRSYFKQGSDEVVVLDYNYSVSQLLVSLVWDNGSIPGTQVITVDYPNNNRIKITFNKNMVPIENKYLSINIFNGATHIATELVINPFYNPVPFPLDYKIEKTYITVEEPTEPEGTRTVYYNVLLNKALGTHSFEVYDTNTGNNITGCTTSGTNPYIITGENLPTEYSRIGIRVVQ